MNTSTAWIQTYTNKRFHILEPQQEDICIEDIAHALSLQCRFTGHTKFHYSVAQHAYYASIIVPPEFAFEALMHDASEAYIGDMSRPLKHFTTAGAEYLKVEANIEAAIACKFGLPLVMSAAVKKADNMMLYAEKKVLMAEMEWTTKWADTEEAANVRIVEFTPKTAERLFLRRFNQLINPEMVTVVSVSNL